MPRLTPDQTELAGMLALALAQSPDSPMASEHRAVAQKAAKQLNASTHRQMHVDLAMLALDLMEARSDGSNGRRPRYCDKCGSNVLEIRFYRMGDVTGRSYTNTFFCGFKCNEYLDFASDLLTIKRDVLMCKCTVCGVAWCVEPIDVQAHRADDALGALEKSELPRSVSRGTA